jgi:hypothetical protein
MCLEAIWGHNIQTLNCVGYDHNCVKQYVKQASGEAPKPHQAPAPNSVYKRPSSLVPASGPGLRLSWIVYRGKASAVTFTPEQMKTWTDSRAYANSPWSPPTLSPSRLRTANG